MRVCLFYLILKFVFFLGEYSLLAVPQVDYWEMPGAFSDSVVLDIAVISNSQLFASIDSGGVKYSSNQGNSWQTAGEGLPEKNAISLWIDNDSTLYAGTTDSGLYSLPFNSARWESEGLQGETIQTVIDLIPR